MTTTQGVLQWQIADHYNLGWGIDRHGAISDRSKLLAPGHKQIDPFQTCSVKFIHDDARLLIVPLQRVGASHDKVQRVFGSSGKALASRTLSDKVVALRNSSLHLAALSVMAAR